MNSNNHNQKNSHDSTVEIDTLDAEPLDPQMLGLVSKSFHEFHEALGADLYNRFLRDVEKHRKLGRYHGVRIMLTMLKTYEATVYWFDLSRDKKIELVQLLWEESSTDFDDDMEFEPKFLTDEEVEFVRLVADFLYAALKAQQKLVEMSETA